MSVIPIEPNFWFYWFVFCGIIMGGYLVMASGSYYLLYLTSSIQIGTARSEIKPPKSQAITSDIKLSILSGFFFALVAACFMICYRSGLTQIYMHGGIQNLGYFLFSYALVLLLQDTFFYFLHRLFHRPFLFKWLHQGHHLSRPPTPWTFFALGPMEAVSQAAFLLFITLLIPLHIGVLIAVLLTMSTWAMGNHLGFQIVPNTWLSRQLGRWLIGSAHHLVHHQKYTRHYGLYFTFWDKLLGTQDEQYEANQLSGSL